MGNFFRLLALISLLATRFVALDGNGFDPHGGPKPGTSTSSDEGPGIDPFGRAASSAADEGSGLDPHG